MDLAGGSLWLILYAMHWTKRRACELWLKSTARSLLDPARLYPRKGHPPGYFLPLTPLAPSQPLPTPLKAGRQLKSAVEE